MTQRGEWHDPQCEYTDSLYMRTCHCECRRCLQATALILEDAFDLYRHGENSATAYERGDLLRCNQEAQKAELLKKRLSEALVWCQAPQRTI